MSCVAVNTPSVISSNLYSGQRARDRALHRPAHLPVRFTLHATMKTAVNHNVYSHQLLSSLENLKVHICIRTEREYNWFWILNQSDFLALLDKFATQIILVLVANIILVSNIIFVSYIIFVPNTILVPKILFVEHCTTEDEIGKVNHKAKFSLMVLRS